MSTLADAAAGTDLPGTKGGGMSNRSTSAPRALRTIESIKARSMSIMTIACSPFYVRESALISDLADDLSDRESVFALGVVDGALRTIGIIVRRELFDTLGRQFGRDLYKNKRVNLVMRASTVFEADRTIFSVEEELSSILYGPKNHYFAIADNTCRFAGIFSTRDMLIFLSQLTKRDIDLARRLQASMVPGEFSFQGDRVGIAAGSVMAKGVGGDYYYLDRYDAENWAIMLCDVSGKGIAASLISAIIGGMASVYDFSMGMRNFVLKLNAFIASTFESEKFITGMFANLGDRNGELTLFDMGHSQIYLFRNGAMVRIATKDDNIPVGVRPDIQPRAAKLLMKAGDVLIVVTDGFLEQPNPANEEYGIARLGGIVAAFREKGLRRMKDEVISSVHLFRKSQAQLDDMTILFIEYLGKDGSP